MLDGEVSRRKIDSIDGFVISRCALRRVVGSVSIALHSEYGHREHGHGFSNHYLTSSKELCTKNNFLSSGSVQVSLEFYCHRLVWQFVLDSFLPRTIIPREGLQRPNAERARMVRVNGLYGRVVGQLMAYIPDGGLGGQIPGSLDF